MGTDALDSVTLGNSKPATDEQEKEQREREELAAVMVACNAGDPDDVRMMLEHLGLIDAAASWLAKRKRA